MTSESMNENIRVPVGCRKEGRPTNAVGKGSCAVSSEWRQGRYCVSFTGGQVRSTHTPSREPRDFFSPLFLEMHSAGVLRERDLGETKYVLRFFRCKNFCNALLYGSVSVGTLPLFAKKKKGDAPVSCERSTIRGKKTSDYPRT